MPIRPEFRHFYRGPQWEQTRQRILERAGHQCERCGKPNHRRVWTVRDGSGRWSMRRRGARWRNPDRSLAPVSPVFERKPIFRIFVVLTIAHLNHVPGDDRDENLRAWCQRCHLVHDLEHHRQTRSARKDEGRALLQPLLVDGNRQVNQ